MFVEYMGMTPMEAIVAATRNGAFAMRMEDEVGTLEHGRIADVLVVDGDPLADVRVLQDKGADRRGRSRAGGGSTCTTPIPEHRPRASDQVRFLAACPLTRSLALTEEQLERLSHV